MGKRKDEYVWNHMEKLVDGVKCNYCSTSFKGRPSVSRLKSHLLGTPNQGIIDCKEAPSDVKLKLAELDKRRKTDAAGSLCFDLQTGDGAGGSGGMGEGGGEEIRVEHREPITEGANTADLSQAREEDQPPVHPESLQLEARTTTQGIKLLTAAFVDDSFRRYLGEVWHWLMYGNVQGVGLFGMGGIGKTALAKHINNKLLTDPNPFHHVYWVGVSQGCSIRKLQNAIAEAIDLSLPSFGDENICAARLREAIVTRKKSVLILDDVWEFVDLERVGVPIGYDACNFVVTSRIRSVCRQMGCQKIIKLDTLSETQSWNLFVKTLGNATTLANQIKEVAKSIVKQCKGLPLGIVTIAKCMRGVVDLREWRNVSEELKGLQPRPQIMMEIFDSLKLSYSALRKPTLKNIFVFCSLIIQRGNYRDADEDEDEDEDDYNLWIRKNILTHYLVANKLTTGHESRAIEFEDIDHSLDLLEDVSLLQFKPHMRLHGLVKIMGILMLKERDNVLIEVGKKKLKDLPGEEKWTSELEEVFLINTNIRRIDSSHAPKCPRLSSLYLCCNRYLKSIEDSFFQHFSKLEVLDLSFTSIVRLPYCVWNLVNLTSLNVSSCKRLKKLPRVSKLVALKKLDMSDSGIVKVPYGMEFLVGLNYLNLFGTEIYELPHGLLTSLSGLQCLVLNCIGNGVELAALKDLEILICGLEFSRLSESVQVMNVIERLKLKHYFIHIEDDNMLFFEDLFRYHKTYSALGLVYSKVVRFRYVFESGDPRSICLPASAQCLEIFWASPVIWKSIVLQSCAGLRCLCISYCDDIDYLCCFPFSSSSGISFESLEILELKRLTQLVSLFAAPSPEASVPLSPDVFCHLRELDISSCSKIVKLFPANLLLNLQNLEHLMVRSCDAMEVIFEEKDDNNISTSYSTGMLNLPKLKILELLFLPRLQKISSQMLMCASLQRIEVNDCRNLSDISIHLPIPSLELVIVYPKEWWQSVNWENPHAKSSLPLQVESYLFDSDSD